MARPAKKAPAKIHYLKGYTVFNVEQIDGLPDRFTAKAEPRLSINQRSERAENFFAATGAEGYYATLAHEGTHWTKHPKRVDREFGRKRWGDEGYAMEELVAELGAAFLCADLELTPEPREEHASYLDHWLKVLKGDKRAILTAASHAQRAADFLHGLQPHTQAVAAA
jgi:antirestriction protein ArdC